MTSRYTKMYLSGASSTDSKKSDSDQDLDLSGLNLTKFKYGKPKLKYTLDRLSTSESRLCKSENNSSSVSCASDSSVSDGKIIKSRRRNRRKSANHLPPMGIFWDIENCHVPKNKCASMLVHRIRELFLTNYREVEFLVVCDVKKENPQVIQDLHDTQVNLVHVQSTSKNAADEKLRQALRRFAEIYSSPATVILISSDVNFAADLCDLRYRKKIRVVLIHNTSVADALILCANETYSFSDITEDLPVNKREKQNLGTTQTDLLIYNLPLRHDKSRIKNRLKMLTDNCGGRVMNVVPERGVATVRFSSIDFATRAQRRIQGEDVFGNKIKVLNPVRDSPLRNYTGRRVKNSDYQLFPNSVAPNGSSVQDAGANLPYYGANVANNPWKPIQDMSYASALVQSAPLQVAKPANSISDKLHDYNWPSKRAVANEKHSVSPQDSLAAAACALPVHFKSESKSEISSDSDRFSANNTPTSGQSPVEFFITNLDPTLDVKELHKILMNMLKKYAMILNLSIIFLADGYPAAVVKVSSQQEAQYIISQLHRQKLGSKRIVISYTQNNIPMRNLNQLRAMIVALLQEAPGKSMPLFKMLGLLETRFHCSVSVSEVNKLKDICSITEELGGRMISLTQSARTSPPSNFERALAPYCMIHCPNGIENRGWGEPDNVIAPNVMMPLKLFSSKVNDLLTLHMGAMPLLSFQVCYELEFAEPLPIDESGVPLEHLLTCVPNVDVKYDGPSKNIKYVKREQRNAELEKDVFKSVPPSLLPNVNLLCREIVDLLKMMDRCQLLWSRFIPAYHQHFGRQCRVADYGYTKLLDLFEAIPHVVQLMGGANRRVITLSHPAQLRRFTSDLLRVLKAQPSKQLRLRDFPALYERALGRPFAAPEYGVCYLEDLVAEVPDGTVVVTRESGGVVVAIPKREQTAEETIRTKQFAHEVVELLRHTPQCAMLFNKFIPAYHHHFGYQCRVSDFGFTRLIELFEAISDVVKIEELPDGDRKVSLTAPYALKVLGSQLQNLIKNSKLSSVPLEALPSIYMREYGYPLKPSAYECGSLPELLSKLLDVIQVTNSSAGVLVALANVEAEFSLTIKVWALLNKPPYSMNISKFMYEYQMKYNNCISMSLLGKMKLAVTFSTHNNETRLSLTPLYTLAAEIYEILFQSGGQIIYTNLHCIYKQQFSRELNVASYNVASLNDFINEFNWLFVIKGNKKKARLALNRKLTEYSVPLPRFYSNSTPQQSSGNDEEMLHWPPPPAHDLVLNNGSHITPPKPDTPPSSGSVAWNNGWHTPSKSESDGNLAIALPTMQTPKLLDNPGALLSPARNLLSAYSHPLDAVIPMISAPDPAQLPLPDKLLEKGKVGDDSNDSGVINISKLENTHSDGEMEMWCDRKYKF